ncbi:MAG: hypothetical protein Fur0015_13030 [Ignavibacteriales bacterium]
MNKTSRNKNYVVALLLTITSLSLSSVCSAESKLIQTKKFDVNDGGLITVKTSFGDVNISSWSNSEVEIRVYGNKKTADKIRFSFEKSGNEVIVKAEKKGNIGFNVFNNFELKYEIKVPKNFSSSVATAGGDISMNGLNGEFEFKTSGGDIEIADNVGKTRAFTSGGDIEIKNHKGNIKAETSGGDIKIQTFGNVDCGTSGGDIDLICENGSVNAGTSGGDVALKYWGKNYGIKCETSGGDISCVVPDNFKADVELKTIGGDIDLNFANANTNKISHSKFYGKFNGGGEKFICTTIGGSIKVNSSK